MAANEETGTRSQPVTFFDELDRAQLEQVFSARVKRRFSTAALRAALFPRHWGEMDQPDGYANLRGHCGDLMTFFLRIQDGCIQSITFTTEGCDATIASGEMLASMVTGLSLEEAQQVTPEDLLSALDGLPPNHVHCASVAVATLREAIEGYQNRRGS